MKIGIIGRGTVGDAVYHGLAQVGNDLSHYDIKDQTSIVDVINTDLVFICVPTDSTDTGHCDVSIVADTVARLDAQKYQGIVAIKSTVIPGTTDRLIAEYPNLRICYVPEFLRQKSAHSDFFDYHDVLIVGAHDNKVANLVVAAHRHIPNSISIIRPVEAEVTKYFNNVHNALEIVFANAVYEMCDKLSADYQEVLGAISKRRNINSSYLKCSKSYRGYEGHCLPKDTLAWKILAKDLGVDVKLFQSLIEDNRRYLKCE